ncbi:MAG: response regulator transcription factor [Verrucomicrobiota bacterium]|nr:response regulator transcription factor [Verrucomicrobiota bacterium]
MKALRILLVDDHLVVRQGLRFVIENRPGWSVCGEAESGREAVELAEKLKPDIVVMDMTMPELNGLEATRQIRRRVPGTEVLIFTGDVTNDLVHAVFEAGARSYVVKTDGIEPLIAGIEALAAHKTYFTAEIGEIIFARYLKGKAAKDRDEAADSRLTEREQETIQLLAEGNSNKEVAQKLGISVKTAETHRAAVMRKLKLVNFSDLVRYAIRNRIIQA